MSNEVGADRIATSAEARAHFTHLKRLEAESIHIMREVAA